MKRIIIFIQTIMTSLWLCPLANTAMLDIGERCRDVAFSPNGKILAVATSIGIYLYNPTTRVKIAVLKTEGRVNSASFSPDGSLLASGSDDSMVKLWNATDHEEVATLGGHSDSVESVSFSPDGSLLATGSADSTVKLWDVSGRHSVATLTGHSRDVYSVAFSPDGRLLASGSRDETVKLWDIASRQEIGTLSGHSRDVLSVAFSPDGRLLTSGSGDDTVKLWDVVSHQEIATLRGHSNRVYSVAFSPDGRLLASASRDDTVRLWDVVSHQEVATLTGHSRDVLSVAFSPDGRLLASGSEDGTVRLWDYLDALNYPPRLALNPSGDQEIDEGETLTITVKAEDPDGDDVTLSTGELPKNAGFNVKTGRLTFRPDFTQSGEHVVTFEVKDDRGGTDEEKVTIMVIDVPHDPVLTLNLDGNQKVDEAQILTVSVTAEDPDGDILTLSALNLPKNASFRTKTGTFFLTQKFIFTPNYTQSGKYIVTFRVNDDTGGIDEEKVVITVVDVNRPPVLKLNPSGDQQMREGKTINISVTADDPDEDDVTLSTGKLPRNASFDAIDASTWRFTFKPDHEQAGEYEITFQADDGRKDGIDEETVTMMVRDVNRPPVLMLDRDGDAQYVNETEILTMTVRANDADGDIPTLSAEPLPKNANFDAIDATNTWRFAFTPDYNQAGEYEITFQADDGKEDGISEKILTIVVGDMNRPPVLILNPDGDIQYVSEAEILTITVRANDPDGDIPTFSAEPLPRRARFSKTGEFSFGPDFTQAGEYIVVFKANDVKGGIDERAVTIVVYGKNRSPILILNPSSKQYVDQGRTVTITARAHDPDEEDTVILSVVDFPRNCSFDRETGEFTFTPDATQAGEHTITFRADDRNGGVDEEKVIITVNGLPVISNLQARQRPGMNLVDITYDIEDKEDNPVTFTVRFSGDGGKTFANATVPPDRHDGVGEYTTPGTGKSVIWNAGRDLPNVFGTSYVLEIGVRDSVQSESTPTQAAQSAPFPLDTTAPEVTILSPKDGEIWDGSREIIWQATDIGDAELVIGVDFTLDGSITWRRIAGKEANDGILLWDTTTVEYSESCQIKIKASDGFNNTCVAMSETFTIDNSKVPEVKITWIEGESGTIKVRYASSSPIGAQLCTRGWQFSRDNASWLDIGLTEIGENFLHLSGSHYITWDTEHGKNNLAHIDDDSVWFRVKVTDGRYFSAYDVFGPFHIDNNEPPSASARGIPEEQISDVVIRFSLSDTEGDMLNIKGEYSLDEGETWKNARLEGDTTNISSGNYANRRVIWKAPQDLAKIDNSNVYFRIIPYDRDEGTPGIISGIHIDYNQLPSVIVDDIFPTMLGDVPIGYTLSDPEGDALSIRCEYTKDSGKTWRAATVTGKTSGIPRWEYRGSITWDSEVDLPSIRADTPVIFRITVSDNDTGGVGSTQPFLLFNNAPPIVELTDPATEVTGDVILGYQLADMESQTLSILVEYSTDSGTMWKKATVVGEISDIPKREYSGSVLWKSKTDLPDVETNVQLRLTPSDPYDVGIPDITESFILDNKPIASFTASGKPKERQITLVFDDAIASAYGNNVANFSLDATLQVVRASWRNPNGVLLTLQSGQRLTAGTAIAVTASNVTDNVGNVSPAPLRTSFQVIDLNDISPPLPVTWIDTPKGWISDTSPDIRWNAGVDEESGVVGYEYLVDDRLNHKVDGGSWESTQIHTAVTPSLSDGEYEVWVRARNGVGLYSEPLGATVRIDTTPPPVVMNVKDTGNYTIHDLVIDWDEAIDNLSGVVGYYLQVSDGKDFSGEMLFDGLTGSNIPEKVFPAAKLTNGRTYYARVKAKNGAGLLSRNWSNVTDGIMAHLQPPSIALVSIYSQWENDILKIEAKAVNDGSIRDVLFQYSLDNRTWRDIDMDTTPPYSADWDTVSVIPTADDSVWVKVVATDHYGLTGEDIIDASFGVDNAPPSTTDNYDGRWHKEDFVIALTGDDKSGSRIASINYRVNDGVTKSTSENGHPRVDTEGGSNKLEYWSVDNAGNEEKRHMLFDIKLDKTKPVLSDWVQEPVDLTQLHRGAFRVKAKVADAGGSGILGVPLFDYHIGVDTSYDGYEVMVSDGNGVWHFDVISNWNDHAGKVLYYKAQASDAAGNISTSTEHTELIEKKPPPLVGITTKYRQSESRVLTIEAEATNADGSIRDVLFQYSLDNKIWHNIGRDATSPYSVDWDTTSAIPTVDDSVWVKVVAIDNDGLIGADVTDASFGVDNEPPTTTNDYDSTWHRADFVITLTGDDKSGSGIASINYRINDGTVKSLSKDGHPGIDKEGDNSQLEYWGVDNAGNKEKHRVLSDIKLDKTKPTFTEWVQQPEDLNIDTVGTFRIKVKVTDNLSGCKTPQIAYHISSSYGDYKAMSDSGDGYWCFDISEIWPGYPDKILYYKVKLEDKSGNVVESFERQEKIEKTEAQLRRAIIVAGGPDRVENNKLWPTTSYLCNYAYKTLQSQGYTHEMIQYLSPAPFEDIDGDRQSDVNDSPTVENLRKAIGEWPVASFQNQPNAQLVFYITGHGYVDNFQLDRGKFVTASMLAHWLETLQTKTALKNIIIVIDGSHSLSFIDDLAAEGRHIITSTDFSDAVRFDEDGRLSFSQYFFQQLNRGFSIAESFRFAKEIFNNLEPPFNRQKPSIESNGNGIPNEPEDEAIAENVYIGDGILGTTIPEIDRVLPQIRIQDTTTACIWAEVSTVQGIHRVWAVIIPPSHPSPNAKKRSGMPKSNPPVISLSPTSEGDQRYEGCYDGFVKQGEYVVIICAEDEVGNVSVPRQTSIIVPAKYPIWDATQNGVVDIFDLAQIGRLFGDDSSRAEDLNDDQMIDGIDLKLAARHFGEKYVDEISEPITLDDSRAVNLSLRSKFVRSGKDQVMLEVKADDASQLYAFQFDMIFDPSRLSVLSISDGTWGRDNPGVYCLQPQINSEMGRIAQIIYVQTGKAKPHETAILARVMFQWKVPFAHRQTVARLENLKLSDENARPLAVNLQEPIQTALGNLFTTWGKLKTALLSNYPNPFNPETWIPYDLAEPGVVTIQIYNVSGRLVRTLALGRKPAGRYLKKEEAAYWNGTDDFGQPVASGIYFYTLKAGSFAATRKMALSR